MTGAARTDRFNRPANVGLAAIILSFLLLSIYAVSRAGEHPAGTMHKYYAISFVGILLCSLAWRLRGETKMRLVMIVVSIVCGLYLIELIMPLLPAPSTDIAEIAREQGIAFDTRTKAEVVLDLRAQGKEAYPCMQPQFLINTDGMDSAAAKLYPLGTVSRKTTVLCNESGTHVVIESDERGFNNPKGVWSEPEIDVALIGDSYAQGYCVASGDDIAGQLRRSGRSVVNLGSGGNGPLLDLALVEEYAKPLKPDVVLWQYFEGNDIRDLGRERKSSLLMRYLGKGFSQDLINRQDEIDAALEEHIDRQLRAGGDVKGREASLLRRLRRRLTSFVKLYHLRIRLGLGETNRFDSLDPLFAVILERARDAVASWGGQLYFLYVPEISRYDDDGDPSTLYNRGEVLAAVARLEIPVIDFHEVLVAHDDPRSLLPLRAHGHYTAEGYRLLARTIGAHLTARAQMQRAQRSNGETG